MRSLALAAFLIGFALPSMAQADLSGPAAALSGPVVLVGADGVETTIHDASRIVAMGGSITEILYALGVGNAIVGADISSNHPPEIKTKPRLGFFRTASSEGILSLNPSVVIGSVGLGPPGVPQQLRSAGVPLLLSEEAKTIEQAFERILLVGDAVSRSAGALEMIDAIRASLEQTRAATEDLQAPRVLFIYARGAGSVQVAGANTAAETTIELAGATNAITGFNEYRPLTAEAVVTAAPDVILMPERGLESIGGIEGLMALPGIALTPAAQNGRIITVDDSKLLGFGPRFADAVAELAKGLFGAELLKAEAGR